LSVTDAAVVPPDPVRENPPADSFCDLVLNGGVASGVVYPWALIELARVYRFKSIGGNSVGAMAAAVAAAGEYGRCIGIEDSFEPLRRFPLKLAEKQPGGGTKMLRLFQPSKKVRRLFDLFLDAVHTNNPKRDLKVAEAKRKAQTPTRWDRLRDFFGPLVDSLRPKGAPKDPNADPQADWTPRRLSPWGLVRRLLAKYLVTWPLTGFLFLVGAEAFIAEGSSRWLLVVFGLTGAVILTVLIVVIGFLKDLRALAKNDYGLCTGLHQEEGQEGLVEWLHKGIQLAAGRDEHDPPLTFAELWAAPRSGQNGPSPLPGGLQPLAASIDLQMFASNVTMGRPVRLPLNDPNTRLFYHPEEWERYFPDYVLKELHKASRPYQMEMDGDPDPAAIKDDKARELMQTVRELPCGGMPIVVAARLSLCFPVLFSCVGVYAIDYEGKREQRQLRRCLLSDGGLCSNFPIHLFDSAHPQWPTFGFLLDSRLVHFTDENFWRPVRHLQGRADNWLRFVPGARTDGQELGVLRQLLGFTAGMIVTMKDWNDRVTARLPHVRNRIVRLALRDGEGQLNLDMPPETILRMAREYGTDVGVKLRDEFVNESAAWREHLYVRSMIELRSLREHVRGYTQSVSAGGSGTVPLRRLLDEATQKPPLRSLTADPDPSAAPLTAVQRQALERAVKAVEALEAVLSECERDFGPYIPVPEPALHLRPPL
jgi:predicted acylesterase/phospholipase RssA